MKGLKQLWTITRQLQYIKKHSQFSWTSLAARQPVVLDYATRWHSILATQLSLLWAAKTKTGSSKSTRQVTLIPHLWDQIVVSSSRKWVEVWWTSQRFQNFQPLELRLMTMIRSGGSLKTHIQLPVFRIKVAKNSTKSTSLWALATHRAFRLRVSSTLVAIYDHQAQYVPWARQTIAWVRRVFAPMAKTAGDRALTEPRQASSQWTKLSTRSKVSTRR